MKKERKNRSGGRMVSNSKAKIQEGIQGRRGSGPVVGLSDQKTFGKKLGARGVSKKAFKVGKHSGCVVLRSQKMSSNDAPNRSSVMGPDMTHHEK